LDDVLCGGLPCGRLYLVQGDPGVGKTTLGLQFLLEGVRRGEPALYITLSESREELQDVGTSHEWDLSGIHIIDLSTIQEQIGEDADNTFFRPSEVELNRVNNVLLQHVERVNPKRVVLDSLSELRLLAETSLRHRRQVLQLKQFFGKRRCTVLFLDDQPSGSEGHGIQSIAHGVITLKRISPDFGVSRRQVNVQKIRGAQFREGNHDFILRRGGMMIFPRLVAAEHPGTFERGSFSSGVDGLDALLGGGLDRGTSNMFMGPPGTGKSTLAIKFLIEAARRGENGQLFTFDETIGTLMGRAAALGMDLSPHVESGKIIVQQVNPAEISPGEMSSRIAQGVSQNNVKFVVIDSINGYLNAMLGERHLDLQLHELLAYLNQQGVITIMVLAQQGVMGAIQAVIDLTYLADTVLMLRYFEDHGSLKQAISVIKKRSGTHERAIREMVVQSDGIFVGEPLNHLQGVLTGVPHIADLYSPTREIRS
jgi:circadian clock protein KaiC